MLSSKELAGASEKLRELGPVLSTLLPRSAPEHGWDHEATLKNEPQ